MGATHDHAGIAANMNINVVDDWVFDSYNACTGFDAQHNVDFVGYGEREWKIASNVRLRSNDTCSEHYYSIVLYDTEIVRYYRDNQTFSVDNGGFNTPTTATRVTQFTPAGYYAMHFRKQLVLNGRPTGHDNRFPLTKASYSA